MLRCVVSELVDVTVNPFSRLVTNLFSNLMEFLRLSNVVFNSQNVLLFGMFWGENVLKR